MLLHLQYFTYMDFERNFIRLLLKLIYNIAILAPNIKENLNHLKTKVGCKIGSVLNSQLTASKSV